MVTKIARDRLRQMLAANWSLKDVEAVSALPALLDHMDEQDKLNAELLSALQKIVNNWDDLHPKDRAQARAALAKARGETP